MTNTLLESLGDTYWELVSWESTAQLNTRLIVRVTP